MHSELDLNSRASGEKVVESREWDQPYSEQQRGAKSSTLLLLAFPGRGGAAPKQKEEESAVGRTEQKGENTHTHTHSGDFSPVLA